VLRYDGTTGAFMGAFVPMGSGGLQAPVDLVFGRDGNLYVSNVFPDSVLRYDGVTGAFVDAFVPEGSGGLDSPGFLVFSPAPVPEPATLLLVAAGMARLLAARVGKPGR
jgi:hypothetical protein